MTPRSDSGLTTDVFSVLEQYTDAGSNHFLNHLNLGAAITDTDPYPASGGCTADTGKVYPDGSGYSACVTDAQIQPSSPRSSPAHGLPTGLSHLYVVFLAKGVESCITTANEAGGGDCTVSAASTVSNSFCSYHSAFGQVANPTVYDDIPYAVSDSPTSGFTCSSDAGSLAGGGLVGNQSPNGNLAADTSISLASHEMSEAFTDPEEHGLVRRRRRPERDRRRLRLHLRRFVDLPWPGGRRIQRDDQRRPLLHPGGVQQQRLRREQGERVPPGRLLDGDVQRQRRHREHGRRNGELAGGADRERLHPGRLHLHGLEHGGERERHRLPRPGGLPVHDHDDPVCAVDPANATVTFNANGGTGAWRLRPRARQRR